MPPVSEEITVHGRTFQLTIEGPDGLRRFSAIMTDVATGRPLTRNPVRGRSAADARDRALEVMHNLLGIERFYDQVLAVAAQLAPGAAVDLTEDAQAIHAEVSGTWELGVPLAVARDDVTDPEADPIVLRERIEVHFRTHLRRVG
ncbi:MAG: hypothetical protein E6H01_06630 [Bacillati bacterium ANGP1]|uniref:Uncharacterized protein n=1 Tax=Candidatus Segetimicrobium genomatis TaxID=2569760 RepID=A0A537L445_9BACT|nr:MAG: hypothetical protein E6H01_06630 [Terrabacteria group bacterium ANGP1]